MGHRTLGIPFRHFLKRLFRESIGEGVKQRDASVKFWLDCVSAGDLERDLSQGLGWSMIVNFLGGAQPGDEDRQRESNSQPEEYSELNGRSHDPRILHASRADILQYFSILTGRSPQKKRFSN
jgi:hypothetical protein